jgi:hypothetical protein
MVPASLTRRSNGRMQPPSRPRPGDPTVTDLLVRWRGGDERALESLIPLVYAEVGARAPC